MDRRRAERGMELPLGCLQPLARLELCEGAQAVVEGCAGLIGCSEQQITLRTAKGAVRIQGEGLHLEELGRNGAVIAGDILQVEFI